MASATGSGRPAVAFACYDLITAEAVLDAAEHRDAPTVLLVPPAALQRRAGPALVAGCVLLARDARVAVCVQLDHVKGIALIRRGLEAGANAVMADGAHLPDPDNAQFVRDVVTLAGDHGAEVEAELGRIAGDEERPGEEHAGTLTDPQAVGPFLAGAGPACLAVSVGNAHGATRQPTRLDFGLLARLRAAATVPLTLHGGSGVADADLSRLAAAGIAKVNINTQLRRAWLAAAADGLRADTVLDVQVLQSERVAAVAGDVLALVSG